MIDFRYFLVSVSAIFVALALGVILGAGPLNSHVVARTDDKSAEVEALRARVGELRAGERYRDGFTATLAPALVKDRLKGRQAVVVPLPGADAGLIRRTTSSLQEAGATVTGTVEVTRKWADPRQRQFLDDLAAQLATDGGRPAGSTKAVAASSPYERASDLLARAVVGKRPTKTLDTAATTIMGAFDEGGLAYAKTRSGRADLAVIVAPSAKAENKTGARTSEAAENRSEETRAWAVLARAFDRAGSGAVMVGTPDSVGKNGAITAVRSDVPTAAEVSTVDVADWPAGRVAAVWALTEQLSGKAGHYGMGSRTDGPMPGIRAFGTG